MTKLNIALYIKQSTRGAISMTFTWNYSCSLIAYFPSKTTIYCSPQRFFHPFFKLKKLAHCFWIWILLQPYESYLQKLQQQNILTFSLQNPIIMNWNINNSWRVVVASIQNDLEIKLNFLCRSTALHSCYWYKFGLYDVLSIPFYLLTILSSYLIVLSYEM